MTIIHRSVWEAGPPEKTPEADIESLLFSNRRRPRAWHRNSGGERGEDGSADPATLTVLFCARNSRRRGERSPAGPVSTATGERPQPGPALSQALISVLSQRRTCVWLPPPPPVNPTSMAGHKQPIKPGLAGASAHTGPWRKRFLDKPDSPLTNIFSPRSLSRSFPLLLYSLCSRLWEAFGALGPTAALLLSPRTQTTVVFQ